jgi:hypothetical protein
LGTGTGWFGPAIAARQGGCQSPFGERVEMQQKRMHAAFSGLTAKVDLPMFRALPRDPDFPPWESVAQPVEQLTFNQ